MVKKYIDKDEAGNPFYKLIVIGVSLGGMQALEIILPALPVDFPIPIIIVQHIPADRKSQLADLYDHLCDIKIIEANEKDILAPGIVYFSAPGYHLLVEEDGSLSLSQEPMVNYARPSINVLFESAAFAYEENVIGIILTGANNDGSQGLKTIKDYGGYTIVQDPTTAEAKAMISAALELTEVDVILNLEDMVEHLLLLSTKGTAL